MLTINNVWSQSSKGISFFEHHRHHMNARPHMPLYTKNYMCTFLYAHTINTLFLHICSPAAFSALQPKSGKISPSLFIPLFYCLYVSNLSLDFTRICSQTKNNKSKLIKHYLVKRFCICCMMCEW